MAYFNEDNVTEQMCIAVAKEAGYEYVNADELREAKNDVIVEPLLQEALIKINHITLAEAQIVIQKVKDVIFQGMTGDIITANQNLVSIRRSTSSIQTQRQQPGIIPMSLLTNGNILRARIRAVSVWMWCC